MEAILNSLAEGFDLPILDWIQANLQSAFMDFIMPIITLFGDAGIFWIACAVVMLIFPKTRKIGLGMGFALIMGLLVCNIILKPGVARIRPYDFQLKYFAREIQLIAGGMHDFSFPSGHTIACFEACTALMLGNKKFGIPATVLAVLVAFSRLYLYLHYPTDVFASVILGTIFGILGYWLAGKCNFTIPYFDKKFHGE
jgi:undecaprenyl-diphosphatase